MSILSDREKELAELKKSQAEFKCFKPTVCCSCAHRHYCPALIGEKDES